MTFDAGGRPIAGTATSIEIDVGNDGTSPDVPASPASASRRRPSTTAPRASGAFLEGNDVILGPELAQGAPSTGRSCIFGGRRRGADRSATGGLDIIHVGDGSTSVSGDVMNVGSPTVGAPTSDYRGGNDEILGLVTEEHQGMSGDASRVYGGSRLTGGNDSIFIQSTNAHLVASRATPATRSGRSSAATTTSPAARTSSGDAGRRRLARRTRAAASRAATTRSTAATSGEYIVGDVYKLRGGRLVGGDDTINGGGGNDIIAGDAYEVRSDSIVTGGDDVIHAGGGNDEVYGDAGYGPTGRIGVGGNDRIYGESGNDRLHGDGGADTLDGGTQSDTLYGGDGNDWLSGGADNDTLYGDAGDDQLDGGAGADVHGRPDRQRHLLRQRLRRHRLRAGGLRHRHGLDHARAPTTPLRPTSRSCASTASATSPASATASTTPSPAAPATTGWRAATATTS